MGKVFEATKEIKGVPPLKSFYEHEPKYYGCYNSIQRIANWLTNRIKFLDSIYEYNV